MIESKEGNLRHTQHSPSSKTHEATEKIRSMIGHGIVSWALTCTPFLLRDISFRSLKATRFPMPLSVTMSTLWVLRNLVNGSEWGEVGLSSELCGKITQKNRAKTSTFNFNL